MRSFEYRKPRWKMQFEVEFLAKDRIYRGVCMDVSDAGIRAILAAAVPLGSFGALTLRHPKQVATLDAVVAHHGPGHVGLAFLLKTPAQRSLAGQFLAAIRKRGALA